MARNYNTNLYNAEKNIVTRCMTEYLTRDLDARGL